jgi:hypothetical protein
MIPILSLFSMNKKVVMLLIAVVAIGSIVYAGKSYIDNKDDVIASLNKTISDNGIKINQLENNISVYKGQIISLKNTIKDKEYIVELSEKQAINLKKNSAVITKDLREAEKKLAGRNLSKLKNSKHRELVLKIMNKSVAKQFKVFE